jgi:hypothetical protein
MKTTATYRQYLRNIYLVAAEAFFGREGRIYPESYCCIAIHNAAFRLGLYDVVYDAVGRLWTTYAPGKEPSDREPIWSEVSGSFIGGVYENDPDREARVLALLLLREMLAPVKRHPKKVKRKVRLQ